ncbi:bifunctional diaminohydroxyphosphoribosylaminopyrimidine deaminase/5-amino-6-(5-phosphoribosylamino)uracil reductase RibD [Anaeromyxobacter paludicola]|uniref:Riboflavin biosynthesis protein RibD n=1 Tax=Anaeromyxobacter paludicola TaxID=2918171 RepID=A0ABM7X527_9BACT|nr:bifunctional diaminohydroxyphosphoribosylaminopyrimidine deaminase/5-amino-6-(5-phosphoribosylamino)uracil reductase RibD [Anaeromyxobacter paludicola]BDG06926.1 riboflavin biosynthesis protein RibD [Anaeromyxobacter paludicola]
MTRSERAAAEGFMRLALAEAAKGLGRTSPNPAVGAVLVKDGRVVARGHHARAGGPHAEVVALRRAGEEARGADLYTTLEPCSHFGKTPPCSLALLEAGVRRVFVGSRDPNLLVNGRGIARLRRGGVEVTAGVLREECDALNAHWFRYITSGRPYVTLKAAITLDGKLATRDGDARWVSGEASRAEAHRLRDRVDAVLVGAGTARADDPRLTTRLPRGRGRDPVRVVLDPRLSLPPSLKLFHHRSKAPTLVAHLAGVRIPARRLAEGVQFLACRERRGRIDLHDLLDRLAARGIAHLLVEGGAEVHRSFLDEGLADRVLLFVAPKIAGGEARSWVAGPSVARMADALALEGLSVRPLGEDLLVTAVPVRRR